MRFSIQKCCLFTLFLILNFVRSFASEIPEKPIVVLITSYNNVQWIERNLNSVFTQKYTNYRVIYVDDCSSDGTADLVEEMVKKLGKSKHFALIRNEERKFALSNIYHAVYSCDENEIVVSLDGDDWFYGDQVLSIINQAYCSSNIWLTHGKFIEHPTNKTYWSIPIPEDIIKRNAYREYRCPSHLRTFYAWLFKKIKTEDLQINGNFFEMTWDQAMMFPMIEMAAERHAFIDQLVYVYNTETSLSDNKVNPGLQNNLEAHIRAMPRYERLDDAAFSVPLE